MKFLTRPAFLASHASLVQERERIRIPACDFDHCQPRVRGTTHAFTDGHEDTLSHHVGDPVHRLSFFDDEGNSGNCGTVVTIRYQFDSQPTM